MQYQGNNTIAGKYIGSTEVQKQYLGSTLIWEKQSPTPTPTFDFTFRFNFNTKLWDSSTNTIPNLQGGLETNQFYIPNEGLQYIDIQPDYFDITGISTSYRQLWDFGTWQNNPYVINESTDKGTFIFKVKHTGPAGQWGAYTNVMGCRDAMNAYNWYTSCEENKHGFGMGGSNNISFQNISAYTAPIFVGVFLGDGSTSGYSYDGLTKMASNHSVVNTNAYQSKYFSILVDNNDPAYCLSKFYWCFYSPEALTQSQIEQVINYNENLI